MTDEAFRNEHSKILLQTSNGLREYQIAAVLKTDITKFRFNRTEFADHADFLSFQKELFAQSLYESQTIHGEDLPPAERSSPVPMNGKTPARWSSPQK